MLKNTKKGTTILSFYDGNKWVSLAKQMGKFLSSKTLTNWFGEFYVTKDFLCIDKTPAVPDRSFKAGNKLKCELPIDIVMETVTLLKLTTLAENIHVKTQKASQNNDHDMGEFLGIDKVS